MAFRAHFLNVGLAACTIFEMDDYVVMIDCGYRKAQNGIIKPMSIGDYLVKTVRKKKIDLMLVTHPHHDHYLGIEDLLDKGVTVAEFWGSHYKRRQGDSSVDKNDWDEYHRLRDAITPEGKRFVCYKHPDHMRTFGGCTFRILGPRKEVNESDTRECHDASLVVWVSSPANNFIISGDASDSELDLVQQDWKLAGCSILQASHHGSINGAKEEFIKGASPRETVISTQAGIIQSLPDDGALKLYAKYSKKVLRTDKDGTMTAPLKTA